MGEYICFDSSQRRVLVAVGSAFLILLAVSVGIWYYWTHRSLPPEEIYEKYQKSVVLIYQKTAYVASVGDKLLGEYMGDDSWNYFYLDDKDDVCQGVGGSSGTGFFHFYRW